MALLMLMALPLVGAVCVAAGPVRLAKWWALGWMLMCAAFATAVGIGFWTTQGDGLFRLNESIAWAGSMGIALSVGADSVSMWLILLTCLLGPICVACSFTSVCQRERLYYASLLALQAAMVGVFASRDLILFYICFEFTLAPMYVLVRQWGGSNRRKAAVKLFLYTFTGSMLALAGFAYVAWTHAHQHSGLWTFDIAALTETAQAMPLVAQGWVLLALLAGFAVKVPLFPVHTWLPLAHTEAPTAGSVILAGVLLKLGTYGMFRFALPFAPAAMFQYAPLIALVCLVGVLYAGLICWAQRDVKKLVAYSSVSHLGFCVLGLVSMNEVGLAGSVMYMLNHGLSTGALFLCIGMIYERYHTRDMDELGGLASRMPVWAFFMVFFTMASVGLPGLNGFVSEFMCMMGAFQSGAAADGVAGPGAARGNLGPLYGAIGATGVVIAAMYLLYMVGKVVFGPLREPSGHDHGRAHSKHLPRDLSVREISILTPLAASCLFLGVYPTPVLRTLQAPVQAALAAVPVPAVPTPPAVGPKGQGNPQHAEAAAPLSVPTRPEARR